MQSFLPFLLLVVGAISSPSSVEESPEAPANELLIARPIYRFPSIELVPTVIERSIFRPFVFVDRRWEGGEEDERQARRQSLGARRLT
ncbi:hypothetical protein Ae201684P_016667 [Aphanomyces euteiches]|nr:hypothetical protein Ae201684P_016667 [Aphanomyces euteiches]